MSSRTPCLKAAVELRQLFLHFYVIALLILGCAKERTRPVLFLNQGTLGFLPACHFHDPTPKLFAAAV